MRGVHRLHGLGQTVADFAALPITLAPTIKAVGDAVVGPSVVKDSSGNTIDCNEIYNMTNRACWGIVGGSAGTPLDAAGQVDCSQYENVINGNCSLFQWAGFNPNLSLGLAGGSLLLVGIGALALVILIKR